MIKRQSYLFLLRGLTYSILISLLWVNAVSYLVMLSSHQEHVEICNFGDFDSEEEEKEEQTDQKVQADTCGLELIPNLVCTNSIYNHTPYSCNHIAVFTPPPEMHLSIA